MTHVEFDANGYRCLSTTGQLLFTSGQDHYPLFDYVAADLSALPNLLFQYVSGKMNLRTLSIKRKPCTDNEIDQMRSILKAAHPFFLHHSNEAIIRAIGTFFNELLLYLCYNQHTIDPGFSKTWYLKRIELLLFPLLSIGDHYPTDFYEEYRKKTSQDTYTGESSEDDFEFFIPDVPNRLPTGFAYILHTQNIASNMLHLILDVSIKELAQLSITQRTWMYENIFFFDVSCVPKRISFFHPTRLYLDSHLTPESRETFSSLNSLRYENIGQNGTPENMKAIFDTAIEIAKAEQSLQLSEEYEIEDLRQLLLLETMHMIQQNTMVRKCKNCNKYFIITDRKQAYCSRTDKSGKSCDGIGSKRTFQKKLADDEPLRLYNRAYKTHHARRTNRKMDQNEFEQWSAEAKSKLNDVRSGLLDLTTYQEWLKK